MAGRATGDGPGGVKACVGDGKDQTSEEKKKNKPRGRGGS